MDNPSFNPNLDLVYQVPVAPPKLAATSGTSSLGDRYAASMVGQPPCCPLARSYQREARDLSSRLRLKDTALLHKNQQLQQKEADLIQKEAMIKELKQELQRLFSTILFLRKDVEFWKLACSHAETWRDRYLLLEDSLLAKYAGLVVVKAETGGDVPAAPEC